MSQSVQIVERPIRLWPHEVRAILEGRKTQTRRVMKPHPPNDMLKCGPVDFECWCGPRGGQANVCPYGKPGDRLWVRETLQYGARNNPEPRHNHLWRYAADNALVMVSAAKHTEMLVWATHKEGDICTSIHMPRWASRLTLEIVKVRVERLQEISEADAKAEGVDWEVNEAGGVVPKGYYRSRFTVLWDSINSKRGHGWDKNDWVWAITFQRVRS